MRCGEAVCVFAVPAVAIVLIIITLLLTGWALLVQRHVRRQMARK